MKDQDRHLSKEQLLLDLDGELSWGETKRVRTHLQACWRCRARQQELEKAISQFMHFHQQEFDAQSLSIAGPRTLLKAKLTQQSVVPINQWTNWFCHLRRHAWVLTFIICCLLALRLFESTFGRFSTLHSSDPLIAMPNARFTPGATVLTSRKLVCQQANIKNKTVSIVLQKEVFEEYGITKAKPTAYEVDYLVTPALGGADDIHNLWPHSYFAAWNAYVKDQLEDHLRELVCTDQLDLTKAQQEIATNWIAAYKKYFHTDRPLPIRSDDSR